MLAFNNVPFAATSDSLFSNFLLDTTQGTSLALGLHGSANSKFSLPLLRYRDCEIDLNLNEFIAVASTAIGSLNLADIPFVVQSPLLGLQGLNARPATVSELDVARGFADYLQINGEFPPPFLPNDASPDSRNMWLLK